MPKNPDFEEILDNFNNEIATKNTTVTNNNKKYLTPYSSTKQSKLVNLLYDNNFSIKTAEEKMQLINEFLADIFDSKNINFQFFDENGTELKLLHKIFVKYLAKTNFPYKFWITKYNSGVFGKYGFLIIKQKNKTIISQLEETTPNIIPVKINYKNEFNDAIYEIEVEYDNYPQSNKGKIFTLIRNYSIDEKKKVINVLSDFLNETKAKIEKKDWKKEWNAIFNISSLTYDFIPISVLKNNYNELPKSKNIETRLRMLDKYDENIAILPDWERGGILFNSDPVTAPDQEAQNHEFMKNLLKDGFTQMKPLLVDDQNLNLAENVVQFKPASIMETVIKTRNQIWAEIKEDLGLPSQNEIKSAQKTEVEIQAKAFLTSPIIEREKLFASNFLIDFAKKFLLILKECNILEKQDLTKIDIDQLIIKIEFNLTTTKNINSTVDFINQKDQESSVDESKENKEERVDAKDSFWRRIGKLFT